MRATDCCSASCAAGCARWQRPATASCGRSISWRTDYGIVELEQVAATATLSATEGAPVARSLSAKCSTLRSTLAAEQEAAARVRNDKVTPPLVGMALLFMALIIYPALNLT